jgi:hypothetical protein
MNPLIMLAVILLSSNVLLAQIKFDSLPPMDIKTEILRENFRKENCMDGRKMHTGMIRDQNCNLLVLGSSITFLLGTVATIALPTPPRFYFGVPLVAIGSVGFYEYYNLKRKWKNEIDYYNQNKR